MKTHEDYMTTTEIFANMDPEADDDRRYLAVVCLNLTQTLLYRGYADSPEAAVRKAEARRDEVFEKYSRQDRRDKPNHPMSRLAEALERLEALVGVA